jgi:hypothetical protein
MAKRIAELEDALSAKVGSGEAHPLLSDELLRIKSLPNTQNVTAAIQQDSGTDAAGLAEFFGTLQIGDRPQFFGPTAGAAVSLVVVSADARGSDAVAVPDPTGAFTR